MIAADAGGTVDDVFGARRERHERARRRRAGNQEIRSAHSTGGVVSTTRTLNASAVVCISESVARQTTSLISSSANSAGDAGTHSTGSGPSTASSAFASKATIAPSALCASATMAGRHLDHRRTVDDRDDEAGQADAAGVLVDRLAADERRCRSGTWSPTAARSRPAPARRGSCLGRDVVEADRALGAGRLQREVAGDLDVGAARREHADRHRVRPAALAPRAADERIGDLCQRDVAPPGRHVDAEAPVAEGVGARREDALADAQVDVRVRLGALRSRRFLPGDAVADVDVELRRAQHRRSCRRASRSAAAAA